MPAGPLKNVASVVRSAIPCLKHRPLAHTTAPASLAPRQQTRGVFQRTPAARKPTASGVPPPPGTQLGRTDASLAEAPDAKWGFVVYRTSYRAGDDARFASLLAALREAARAATADLALRPDLLPHLEWTLVEDCAGLERAATARVRLRFAAWCAAFGLPARPGVDGAGPSVDAGADGARQWSNVEAARFHFCLVVDRRSLESVEREAEDGVAPFVGVLWKNWLPAWHPDVLRGEAYEAEDMEPVEGNPDGEVGWFYCPLWKLVEVYDRLCTWDSWHRAYGNVRPPEVLGEGASEEWEWTAEDEAGHSEGALVPLRGGSP